MGAWVNFSNRIEIGNRSWSNGAMQIYGYEDLTEEFVRTIIASPGIRYIQITENLPENAYKMIDRILEEREDMYFRIYSMGEKEPVDLNCLCEMEHLKNLQLHGYLRERQEMFDFHILSKLKGLCGLELNLYELRDYSFLRELSPCLESLSVSAETSGKSIDFDCEWLLDYPHLSKLYLGKKAKRNIRKIGLIPKLTSLTLQGIKVKDYEFLRDSACLSELSIRWNGMNDLSSLSGFVQLRKLELWRIMKLEDISFISTLTGLQILNLIDLKWIKSLPDLSGLKELKEIGIDNVPLDMDRIPDEIRKLIRPTWL